MTPDELESIKQELVSIIEQLPQALGEVVRAALVQQHMTGKHNQKRHGWHGSIGPERAKDMGKKEFLEYEARRKARKKGIKGNSPEERVKFAGNKAEKEVRQRYKVRETSDGYNLIDTNKKTSAGFSLSVNKEPVSKDRAESLLNSRIKSARTRAENQQRDSEPDGLDYDLLVN